MRYLSWPTVSKWLIPFLQTTAHTLGFAFGLLALHPDEQEKLYQHILSVLPDGRLPVRSHNASIDKYKSTTKHVDLRRHAKANTLLSVRDLLFAKGVCWADCKCSVFNESLRMFPSVNILPIVLVFCSRSSVSGGWNSETQSRRHNVRDEKHQGWKLDYSSSEGNKNCNSHPWIAL